MKELASKIEQYEKEEDFKKIRNSATSFFFIIL